MMPEDYFYKALATLESILGKSHIENRVIIALEICFHIKSLHIDISL